MRRCNRFLAVCLMTACLTACSSPSSVSPSTTFSPPPSEEPFFSFSDALSQIVSLPEAPKRTAVLFSSYADLWTLAGGTVSITVGDSIERGFAPAGTPLVDSGAGLRIDLEALIAAEPDFVIGSADLAAQKEACQQLSQMGIPAAALREESFADYLSLLKLFTDLTGHPETYETYGTAVQAEIDAVLESARLAVEKRSEPISVLFLRAGSGDSSTKAKTAADHFVGVMLNELGTVNIADAAQDLSEHLSLESILTNPPDILLIATQGDETAAKNYMDSLLTQSGWRDLDAVQNKRYWYLPKDLFQYKPNARWGEAYRWLGHLLYPDDIPDTSSLVATADD